MNEFELIKLAQNAMINSHCIYSRFAVGAALITKSGKVYTGCNVEFSSYGATVCAERTALVKAISDGEKEFEAIAIVGTKNGTITDYCPPCGICRQSFADFCDKSFKIILYNGTDLRQYTLNDLLPCGFGAKNLE